MSNPHPVKLYDFPYAPNPTKLRVYLAEKGIDIPVQSVDFRKGEQKTPEFLDRNPAGSLPVIELSDGSHLSESLAIIHYLEELNPEPPMMGIDPLSRARVLELERYIDTSLLARIGRVVLHEFFLPKNLRIPQMAERARGELPDVLAILEQRLSPEGAFACGDLPTIADCTLTAALRFARLVKLDLTEGQPRLAAWWKHYSTRPAAEA